MFWDFTERNVQTFGDTLAVGFIGLEAIAQKFYCLLFGNQDDLFSPAGFLTALVHLLRQLGCRGNRRHSPFVLEHLRKLFFEGH
ncbi:MAG: hypothetical protein Q7R57_08180, partial [Dehalococcoidales bacterium]|nr:hypothetical protein [Dehalococcoidales bacterium]